MDLPLQGLGTAGHPEGTRTFCPLCQVRFNPAGRQLQQSWTLSPPPSRQSKRLIQNWNPAPFPAHEKCQRELKRGGGGFRGPSGTETTG